MLGIKGFFKKFGKKDDESEKIKKEQKQNNPDELENIFKEVQEEKEEKKLQWKPYSGFCGAFYRRFCCS